jgi:GDSL-like Lipase/Acylhydrolase family
VSDELPAPTGRRRGGLRRRLLGALALLFLALLAGEVACRVAAALDRPDDADAPLDGPRIGDPGRRVGLLDILRASADDRIVISLKPHLDRVPFRDAPVTTNRFGFRGPEIEVDEGPDTVTIVGIGDSVMFGYGVPDGADYLSVLERLLRQRYPQKDWRCINTAVPGYNTVIEVATLKARGLRFGPDLVILGIASNDLGLPGYVRLDDDPLDLRRCFLFERLARGTSWAPDRNGFQPLEGHDPHLLNLKSDVGRAAVLPAWYDGLKGWESAAAALRELDALAHEHGFPVVTVTITEDPVSLRMLHAAAAMGWTTVRVLPDIQRFLHEHGGGRWDPDHPEAYLASALSVSPGDGHPSALQDTMAADRILADLERTGIIARLLE